MSKAPRQVIINKDLRVYSGIISLHGINNSFDPSFKFTGKLNSLKDSEHVEISEIFHCDGLILCTTKYDRLVVWNPCTGQTRWIPRNRGYCLTKKYFLGYENNKSCTGSYKIVGFNSDYKNQKQAVARVEIYESSSDSWRVVHDVSDWYEWFNYRRGVSLKGNTYWFDYYYYYYKEDHSVCSILMFDFTRERFGRLSLPFQSYHYSNEIVVLSVVRKEKLAVLRFDKVSLEMKIWLTTSTKINEAKDLSWSDFLVVDFGKLMVQSMKRSVSFLVVDEENKMVVCCDSFYIYCEEYTRIYIVGENMHKLVYEEKTTKRTRDVWFTFSMQQEPKEKGDLSSVFST